MNVEEEPRRLDGPGSRPGRSDTCWDCRHYRSHRRCAAFPDGIPEALWQAVHGHREPYPGDQGIQYKRRAEPDPLPDRDDVPEFLRKLKP
ncbi:MAG: hypothetical protein V5B39_16215 [Accumulibacter sp.]|uniref:hypothetical protein n=1 Tax=Accumulibacter sp. TaxID=2053492 RepID=UPI002FC3CB9E